MKINNKIFPYPVLSSDTDDYKTDFSTKLFPEITKTGYKIKLKNKLTDKNIENLIKQNKAIYVLHLECNLTRFRKIYTFKENDYSVEIPKNEVLNRIEYCSMIIAKEKIEEYTNKELDDDFSPFSYTFNKGEILGIGANGDLSIKDEETTLSRKDSIFSIVKSKDSTEVDYELREDKILISLPPKVHENYVYLNNDHSVLTLLLTGLIVPILSSVIDDIRLENAESEHEDKSWFISLKNQIQQLGYAHLTDINDNSIVIAQKLLDRPYDKFFLSINENLFNDKDN